ncbi:hypothetical protein M422DRAFT_271807 [Sphaerobolus stellatus SS14]|uniref:Uncharacterized protein n=1 Tax=Sphaerobolus stellatus (strain SS14) TaxID=990650 RepID=A0A0C9TYY3_SPHS4|nr:hypothetical protein M422DRAFT_271807 [Sphaerobolus stellatus SS14]
MISASAEPPDSIELKCRLKLALVGRRGCGAGARSRCLRLPSAPSSAPVKPRKNQVYTVEWDASLDELKREKESAEAVWDLKTRFRQAQPRLTAPNSTPGRETLEDARHVSKPPDADGHVSKPLNADAGAKPAPKPTSKAELEDFLDVFLW